MKVSNALVASGCTIAVVGAAGCCIVYFVEGRLLNRQQKLKRQILIVQNRLKPLPVVSQEKKSNQTSPETQKPVVSGSKTSDSPQSN